MEKNINVGRKLSRSEQKQVIGGNAACMTCGNGMTYCHGGRNSYCVTNYTSYVICTTGGVTTAYTCPQQ